MNLSAFIGSKDTYHTGQAAGGYQRITAFHIHRKSKHNGIEIQKAKRTFFVGSSAEMHPDYTKPRYIPQEIETDILIHALMGDDILPGDGSWIGDAKLDDIQDGCRRFICNHIAIKDYLVPCHWEEFVRWVSVFEKDNDKKKDEEKTNKAIQKSFERAYEDMMCALERILEKDDKKKTNANPNKGTNKTAAKRIKEINSDLIEDSRILLMARLGSNPKARSEKYTENPDEYYRKKPAEFEKPLPLSIKDMMRYLKELD
jgi:hypothetical protein